jgi:predicted dehydrogenase
MKEETGSERPAPNGLRAMVIGAGFAGEGHSVALQQSGVTVEAMCARTASSVEAMAAKLGIPHASTDWRKAVAEIKPDIVAIGTPAGPHLEIVSELVQHGCHLFCDKPLAPNAPEARRIYELARDAGVKHAYAPTHHYDPSVTWLTELISEGTIGYVGEVEGTFRRHIHPLTPWTWYDSVGLGGGLLHNPLPHWLAILQRTLGGELQAAMGEARVLRHSAPFVPDIHDFRTREARRPSPEQAAQMEWRECDSDNAFTALFQIGTRATFGSAGSGSEAGIAGGAGSGEPARPSPHTGQPAQVSISATGFRAMWPPAGFRFHGEEGTLRADGQFSFKVSLRRAGAPADSWEELPVPEHHLAALPTVGTEFERKWTALARDFVADVLGRPFTSYLTFRDGWRFEEAFDAIRASSGWTQMPTE